MSPKSALRTALLLPMVGLAALVGCSNSPPVIAPTLDASVDLASDGPEEPTDAVPDRATEFSPQLQFSEPVVVADTSGNSKIPVIASRSDGTLHIVWHDFTTDPASLYEATGTPGNWQVSQLELAKGKKSTSAELLVQKDTLHLLWEVWEDEPTLYHAIHQTQWSTPTKIATGKTVTATLDPDGNLHAIFFQNKFPTQAIFDGSAWAAGEPIPLDHTYINTFRIAAVKSPTGIEVAISTSPGGTGYQMRRWQWSKTAGWGPMQTLVESLHLSSDDPHGASDSKGIAHWVWTEQSPLDPNILGVVTMTNTDPSYHWVSAEVGFAMGPYMTIPADDIPLVAWITPRETIAVDRHPYGTPQELNSTGVSGPSLTTDADGYSHLVYSGRDEKGVQQVWYSSNRPASAR